LGRARETEPQIGWIYSLLRYLCLVLKVMGTLDPLCAGPAANLRRRYSLCSKHLLPAGAGRGRREPPVTDDSEPNAANSAMGGAAFGVNDPGSWDDGSGGGGGGDDWT
jgi:hypothetical protein